MLDALRPQSTHDTDADEFALVVDTPEVTELRSTWRITARGHHQVYEGEFTVAAKQLNDISEVLRSTLIPGSLDTDSAQGGE
ncbi:hypothetical protein [Actinosynnema sp. NPDC020468]|uniref:hypothetical protein n=1 Tax=Actinosynnema sp. NPDC020468 TaxID=3154488 RepID=UPI0033D33468